MTPNPARSRTTVAEEERSTAHAGLIEGYRDFEQIGVGGFAVVFRALEERFDRVVAVKVLTVDLDDRARRRFIRECQATGRLSGHPNVVTVLDAGFTRDGQPFMSTQLMERGSLGDWLDTHGAMPLADVLQVGVKMCGALTAVHGAGILHRDIKPQNILVSAYGEPALADFGVSAVGMGSGVASATMAFTPEYTAPEVLEGQPPAPEMDVYSLGSALYTLLAGEPAHRHDDTEGLLPFLRRLVHEPVPPFGPDIAPESVHAVLAKAMATDPAARQHSAEELGHALQERQAELGLAVTPLVTAPAVDDATASSPVAALLVTHPTPPPAEVPARRRTVPTIAAAVLVAAALVAVGLLVATGRSNQDVAAGTRTGGSRGTTPSPANPQLNPAPPVRGGTARVGLTDELPRMNPLQGLAAGSPGSVSVITAVFEPLVRIGGDAELVPFLAERVEPNADFTEWTVTVRPGLTFHDGGPVDASAIRLNLETRRLNPISGPSLKPVVGVDVVDERTTKVRMSAPWSSFGMILSTPAAVIVGPATLNGSDGPIVGTGPFQVNGPATGSSITLVRNDTYWQTGKPHLDAVEFRSYADDARLTDAFDRGELDLMLSSDASSISHEGPLAPVITDKDAQVTFVVLNTAVAPFDDPEVRRAVSYATDRDALVARSVGGLGHRVTAPLPNRSVWKGGDITTIEFDSSKARELVAAYRTRTGKPLEVQLSTVLTGSYGRLAQELKKMWTDAGINVTINALELPNLSTSIVLGRTQAALSAYTSSDPDLWFAYTHSSTIGAPGAVSYNLARFADAEIDRALVDGRTTGDARARRNSYDALFSRINVTAPYLWLSSMPFAIVATPKVTGLKPELAASSSYGTTDWLAGIGLER